MYGRWLQDLMRRWFARIVLLCVPAGGYASLFFIHCWTKIDPFGRVTNVGLAVTEVAADIAGFVLFCVAVGSTVFGVSWTTKWLWREAFHQNDDKKGWWS